jgi:hypothetical protein
MEPAGAESACKCHLRGPGSISGKNSALGGLFMLHRSIKITHDRFAGGLAPALALNHPLFNVPGLNFSHILLPKGIISNNGILVLLLEQDLLSTYVVSD